ncbi:Holliday junction resolvase RuvX [Candidatus Collierbacteria bacterium]|nr:Holliday junction resolvase RuvX [Candidatus Collierbacteria bacterium]
MSFDFGLSHIGVAVGSTDSGLAELLMVINNSEQNDDLKEISKLINIHHPEKLIVGISENLSARQSLDFADKLKHAFSLPVEVADETLTSQEAEKRTLHWKKSKGKLLRHSAAAAVILERWLSDLTPESQIEYK